MKSLGRRALPLSLAAGMITASVALPSAVSADDIPEVSQIDQAIDDLNTCLEAESEPILDVYYLMDGSGSLADNNGRPGSDPEGIRFDAVEESIAPLAELAAADVEVNVAAGTFGNEAAQVLPWTQVDPDEAGALGNQIRSDLKSAFNKEDTNWVAGLALAEEQLEIARQAGPRCQALIWITDGGINLTNDAQVNAEGIEEICGVRPTQFGEAKALGSMFRLRNSGVVVLGIRLSDPNSSNESRTTYFEPIVEGSGRVNAEYFGGEKGDFDCGQVQAGAAGAALPAETPSDLADELWAISICITEECVPIAEGIEALTPGADGDWVLPVPNGIATVVLRPRTDSVAILNPDGLDVCQGEIDCTVRNGSLRLPVLEDPGIWSVSTGSEDSPKAKFLTQIQMDEPKSGDLVAGEVAEVVVPVEQAGQPIELGLFDDVSFTWSFVSDGGVKTSGDVDDTGALMDFVPESGGTLTVTLEVETNASAVSGVNVPGFTDALVDDFTDLVVRPVGDYPSLIGGTGSSSDLVVFPTIEGVGKSTASIVVQGPDSGTGLVCLNAPTIASDPGVDEVGRTLTFSSEFDCTSGGTEIGAGERLEIPVTVESDTQFSGIARGKINVQVEPSDGGRAFPEAVDFEVPTTLQRNDGAAFATIVVLTVLGLVLPYLALLFLARRQASFTSDLDGSRFASLPIRLTPEGLVSVGDIPVSDYSFIFMDRGSVQREVSTAALTHKIEPPRLWPFSPLKCEAYGPANSMVVSNLSGDLSSMGATAPSSQALPDVFVAHFERPSADGPATDTAGADDWGFGQPAAGSPAVALDDQILEGQLVVILPESGNPAEVAERALAKVRVWPRWQEVFSAVKSSSRPVAASSSAPADSPSQAPPREDPLSDW